MGATRAPQLPQHHSPSMARIGPVHHRTHRRDSSPRSRVAVPTVVDSDGDSPPFGNHTHLEGGNGLESSGGSGPATNARHRVGISVGGPEASHLTAIYPLGSVRADVRGTCIRVGIRGRDCTRSQAGGVIMKKKWVPRIPPLPATERKIAALGATPTAR